MKLSTLLATLSLTACPAHAATVTYELTGSASATINTATNVVTYTNAPFSLTFIGDTDNITPTNFLLGDSVQFRFFNNGPFTVTEPFQVFSNVGSNIVGFGGTSLASPDRILGRDAFFTNYRLEDPAMNVPVSRLILNDVPIQTDSGPLTLSTSSLSNLVFNAEVQAVPEPSSALLLGLSALSVLTRRKR